MIDVKALSKRATVSGLYPFASVAALRASSLPNISKAYIESYYGDGNFGGGEVYVNANDTTSTDDSGSIFVDALGRRWYRADQKEITACQFGAKPDNLYSQNGFDNGPILSAAFAWALIGQCGRIVNLEHHSYGCQTTPYIGDPLANLSVGAKQTNPFTVKGTLHYGVSAGQSACIVYYPTAIGQFKDGLTINGVQSMGYFSLENFTIASKTVSRVLPLQTPVNNTVVITGGNSANYVTGTPVILNGGAGGDLLRTRSYWLIKQPGVDTYSFARNPIEAKAGTVIPISSAFIKGDYNSDTTVKAIESGVTNGFATYGTTFSQPRFYKLTTDGIDNAFSLTNTYGGNGEFTHFEYCIATLAKRFFVQYDGTGQAYRPTFQNCSAGIRWEDGICCFETGGADVGYGLDCYSFEMSILRAGSEPGDPAAYGGWRNPVYAVIEHGGYESINFYGGRLENMTGVLSFSGGASSLTGGHPYMRIKFQGMTFTGLNPTSENPLIKTGAGYVGATVTLDDCSVDMSFTGDKYNWSIGSSNNTGTTANPIKLNNCVLTGSTVLDLETAQECGYIELNDCRIFADPMHIYQVTTRLGNAKGTYPIMDKTGHDTVTSYPGMADNQIVYPDFGLSYNQTNVAPPSAWTVTNNTYHPGAFEEIALPTDYATPSARLLRFVSGMTVSQVLGGSNPITPTAFVPFFYMADTNAAWCNNPFEYFEFTLSNSVTGKVYARTVLKGGDNQVNTLKNLPVLLMAYPTATDATGYYKLTIRAFDPSKTGNTYSTCLLRMNWQLASSNKNAAYILPEPGQTATTATSYGANIDTLRAVSKLSLPYKTDAFGSNLSTTYQPDLKSDIYLSKTTEQLMYASGKSDAAGVKWWTIQRVMMAPAMPTTGSWKTTDLVINNAPVVLGTTGSKYVVEGWMRITNGNSNVLNVDWVEKRFFTGA